MMRYIILKLNLVLQVCTFFHLAVVPVLSLHNSSEATTICWYPDSLP
jgi:hypothetical protein